MLFSRRSAGRQEPVPQPPDGPEPAPELPGDGRIEGGVDDTRTQSYIDASLTIVGDLHSAGDVRIDGRLCGNVRCAQLILGRDAAVTGSVMTEQAIVRGKIIGTIRAPVVVIQDTAHVESEIAYCSLAIDEGAYFEGAAHHFDSPDELELAATPPTPRAEQPQQPPPAPARDEPPARAAAAGTEAGTLTPNGMAPPDSSHGANGRSPAK